jgi:DNA-directed RNA polymerase subunit D
MKIEVLSRSESEITFVLEGVTPAFANALRRIMISEVPTMAIEFVDFLKNDSVLKDEVLANRLGLIPLTFDRKAYSLPAECECEGKGCSRCQVKFSLSAKGPCMVFASDLTFKDPSVKPVYEKIPIVELFENEELELEGVAQLGLGKDHAKWQAAIVGYKNKLLKNEKYAEDSFVFNVESVCGLKPEEIVIASAEILGKKAKEFETKLKKLK